MTKILPIRGPEFRSTPKKNLSAFFSYLLYNYNTFLSPEEPNLLFSNGSVEIFADYIKGMRPDYCNIVSGNKREEHEILDPVCNIEYWENYWAYDVGYCHTPTKDSRINHLYFYLQGRPRDHRLIFNHYLKNNNLLESGITSINKRVELNHDYFVFLYKLNEKAPKKEFSPKLQYPIYSSLLHIVSTNTYKFRSYDEKFYRAIYNYKPFLGIACKGWHRGIEEMGFILPDFIDYDFDDEPITEDRMQGVINNLKRLNKLSVKELNELYMDYFNVWEHNYNRVCDMVVSGEGIPKICLEHPHYKKLVTSVEQRLR